MLEVRIALERLSVRLAAAHATEDDLETMRGLLETMADPDVDRRVFNDHDTAFHVALARAAGNRLATDLTAAIRESMLALPDLPAATRRWPRCTVNGSSSRCRLTRSAHGSHGWRPTPT